MLSQAAAAILRLRPGSAARGLPLRVWGRAARRAAEAEAARLERPPGCGRGGVAASFRPPGRRAVAAARVDRAAFAVRAGPSVVPGAAVLQTRALPPLGRETGPWAQQRPRGPSASGFFAGAGIPRSGEDPKDRRHRQRRRRLRRVYAQPMPASPTRSQRGSCCRSGRRGRPCKCYLLLLPRSPASSSVAMATVFSTTRDPRASAACADERLLWYQPGAAGAGFSDGAFPF